jgi:hypothetical protein
LYYRVICSSKQQFTELERRIHRVYWNDGTLDAIIGVVLILIGIGWQLGQVALGAVIPALAIPVWMALRKGLVEPRMGSVVFSDERRQRERHGMWLTIAAGIVSLGIVLGLIFLQRGGSGGIMGTVSPGIPAALIGVAGILGGILFQIQRLALYGCAAFAIAAAGILLGLEPGLHIVACGIPPLVTGVILLGRFLHEFPKIAAHQSK